MHRFVHMTQKVTYLVVDLDSNAALGVLSHMGSFRSLKDTHIGF